MKVQCNDWVTLVNKEKLKRLCDAHPDITYTSKHNDVAGTSRRVSYIVKTSPKYIGVKVKRKNVKVPLGAIENTLSNNSRYPNSRFSGMNRSTTHNNRPPKADNVCPEDEDPDGLPLLKPRRRNYTKNSNVKTC